jgi:hypothetical protein
MSSAIQPLDPYVANSNANFVNLGGLYQTLVPSLQDSYNNLNTAIATANSDPSNPVNVLNAQAAVSQFTLVLTMTSQMMAAYKQATSQEMQNIR